MARYTLVYGVRLIPEGTLQRRRGSDAEARRRLDRRPDAAHLRRHDPAAAPLARPQPRRVLRSAARRGRRGRRDVRRLMLRADRARRTDSTSCSLAAPVSWVLARDVARLAVGLHHRGGLADPARRPDRPRHRGARAPLRPGAGRLPQRHVRQRRGADHRDRRAAQRPHRARQGVDHRQHHRQPAARARAVVLRRRPRPPHRRSSTARRPPTRRRCCSSASSRW